MILAGVIRTGCVEPFWLFLLKFLMFLLTGCGILILVRVLINHVFILQVIWAVRDKRGIAMVMDCWYRPHEGGDVDGGAGLRDL
jgi:hypothetical protein